MHAPAAPLFSIIIPAYNAAEFIVPCLESCLHQTFPSTSMEIIVIDDGSDDATVALTTGMAARHANVHVWAAGANNGPGSARNTGLSMAAGAWIVFLDSDDVLLPHALAELAAAMQAPGNETCDAICYNFTSTQANPVAARQDSDFLHLPREALIRHYLALQMDGAVTFTAMRRSFLQRHALRFAAGLHEDVDFLFAVYLHARTILPLDSVLYGKARRAGSVVGTISVRHIAGFVRAWLAIGGMVRHYAGGNAQAWHAAYRTGAVALIATRVRAIARAPAPLPEKCACLLSLHAALPALAAQCGEPDFDAADTQYFRLARLFRTHAEAGAFLSPAGTAAFLASAADLCGQSWSCTDLQQSLFLAPGELRTCCKRFFRDGVRHGDAVILPARNTADLTHAAIAAAKQLLHRAINRGDAKSCTGCPFLEFKRWPAFSPLVINHLSLEYHSVCNLRCSYCSDTYYGGAAPGYEPARLVTNLLASGALAPDATIVWGGGEPTLSQDFPVIADLLANALPAATQRLLSNAVTYNAPAADLLRRGRMTLTTSIDAGTAATFHRVRGKDRFHRVLQNLGAYANAAPQAVTVKYIVTEGNANLGECRAFADAVAQAGLLHCNFQISCDFTAAELDATTLLPVIALHALLVKAGCDIVFFDDLVLQRMPRLAAAGLAELKRSLAAAGLAQALLEPAQGQGVIIWGAGWQAKWALQRTHYFQHTSPRFLVDSTPSKIGTELLGIPVQDPATVAACDAPVLIAGSQAYPAIHAAFLRLGLPRTRLIRQAII